MASQHRSAWEIRFRALQQFLNYMEDGLQHSASYHALGDNGLSEEKKTEIKIKLKTISDIKTQMQQLRDTVPSRIWLRND